MTSLFESVNSHHVELALRDARRLGRQGFRDLHNYGESTKYPLLDLQTGLFFDSKAILGVAFGHANPTKGPLKHTDFNGGAKGAAGVLQRLGFELPDVAPRAWSFLTVDHRQHGGNDGYDDSLEAKYQWDSTVANHAGPNVGDLAIVRTGDSVLGTGWISALHIEQGRKERFRCPKCRTTAFKARTTLRPRFRCETNGHEFDTPDAEQITVTRYEADYASSWRSTNEIELTEVEKTITSRARQHSIREANLEHILDLVKRTDRPPLVDTDPPQSPPALSPTAAGRNLTSPVGQIVPEAEREQIGDEGEKIVLEAEQGRLIEAGRPDLAESVEWVARTIGPTAGYDIKSFTNDGEILHIEVKTTVGHSKTRFFISAAELDFAAKHQSSYAVHRVHSLRTTPTRFILDFAALEALPRTATTYEVRVSLEPEV